MSCGAQLTPAERSDLGRLEDVIGEGLDSFERVGKALAEVHDRKLYRGGHKTWDDYCRLRWGVQRAYAYRLMTASAVVEGLAALSPIGDKLPATESQARPLGQLPEDARKTVWDAAVNEAGGQQPTASRVEALTRQALAGLSAAKQAELVASAEKEHVEKAARGRRQDDRDERTRRLDKTRSLLKQVKKTMGGLGGEADTFLELLRPLVAELNSLEACA
jgi:hypothetical protein